MSFNISVACIPPTAPTTDPIVPILSQPASSKILCFMRSLYVEFEVLFLIDWNEAICPKKPPTAAITQVFLYFIHVSFMDNLVSILSEQSAIKS